MIQRRKTRKVKVGRMFIGSDAPVSIQTMAKCPTTEIDQIIKDTAAWVEQGLDMLRLAAPDMKSAQALGPIKRGITIPLVADIHFDHRLALEAIKQGVDKVRINPGNMRSMDDVREVIAAAKDAGVAIRIGVNGGSVQERVGLRIKQDEASLSVRMMVDKALEYVAFFEQYGFHDIVISAKTSDVVETVESYRILSQKTDYPLHLGITEAGDYQSSLIKSAVGLGGLLLQGIGDTIRVSMTAISDKEIETGKRILEAVGLRERNDPNIISCPGCGRNELDLEAIVAEVKDKTRELKQSFNVAVLGCVVNGPGEAAHADIGLAGSREYGYIFKGGKIIKTLKGQQALVQALIDEIHVMAGKAK